MSSQPLTSATPTITVTPLGSAKARIKYREAIGVIGGNNYFKGSVVAPVVTEDGDLLITDGWGERRYWGTPYCHSKLSWLRNDITQIDLRWSNKHTFGRPSYYFQYQPAKKTWQRLTARSTVIKALLGKLPVRPTGLEMEAEPEPLMNELELI
jgi:hypothetical protein